MLECAFASVRPVRNPRRVHERPRRMYGTTDIGKLALSHSSSRDCAVASRSADRHECSRSRLAQLASLEEHSLQTWRPHHACGQLAASNQEVSADDPVVLSQTRKSSSFRVQLLLFVQQSCPTCCLLRVDDVRRSSPWWLAFSSTDVCSTEAIVAPHAGCTYRQALHCLYPPM